VRLVRQGALADRRPAPRFGGQQHRVALARAPAVIPRVFLLNERLFSRVR
jgi:ABC-type sulfate/molybdate transport systems ATPase subunit